MKVLTWTAGKLGAKGVSSARLDAELLLARVLGCSRVQLYTGFDRPLEATELTAYRELVRRRLGGEPVAYLLGEQEFWSLPLVVDARVLVPRRDTEALVEAAAAEGKLRAAKRILDLCTGSGAVAIALASELPEATVIATDVSADALAVARENIARHALEARVTLREGDLFAPVADEAPFDLIVANPPYVARATIDDLAPEVRKEPRLALDGGPDGLDLLRRLVADAPPRLTPDGAILLEHGFDQGPAVRALLEGAGLVDVRTIQDLAGQDRVGFARRG